MEMYAMYYDERPKQTYHCHLTILHQAAIKTTDIVRTLGITHQKIELQTIQGRIGTHLQQQERP